MTDIDYMRRALELAEGGRGLTSPNPMVGAVLVRDGEIVGEGSYSFDGVRHAEVQALEEAGEQARGATLYINLEPCSHHGRTPPCAGALIAAGVARVVAGMADPNPLVSGRGFERLRQANIEVRAGVLEGECRRLNEHFARYITGGVFVTLKAAMTLDGRIGTGASGRARATAPFGDNSASAARPTSTRFTSPQSLAFVQRLRHAHDAILTGIGTVLADDPLLTDRSGLPRRRPLLRVVLDSRLRLPMTSRLFQSPDNVLVICGSQAFEEKRARFRSAGLEVVAMRSERPDLAEVLRLLRDREITSLLLEAGSELNASAIESGLVDRLVLFYAPKLLGGFTAPMLFAGPGSPDFFHAPTARIAGVQQLGCDVMVDAYLRTDN